MTSHDPRSVYRDLQRLAKARYAGNTDALLVLYAVEGFLRRLAASPYAENLVLKGGMLMAAQGARRVTRDADLSTRGLSNDEAALKAVVATIASRPADDGLSFDVGTITSEIMREDDAYHGVRVKLDTRLATARPRVALDFSFGDPGSSIPVSLPGLLGDAVELRAYPVELSIAEKVATMMSRADTNTRDRDFADVWVLTRQHAIDAREFQTMLDDIAKHRGHDLVPLSDALAHMPDRQAPYERMLRRNAYEQALPTEWPALLQDIQRFVDPLVADASGHLQRWDPASLAWT